MPKLYDYFGLVVFFFANEHARQEGQATNDQPETKMKPIKVTVLPDEEVEPLEIVDARYVGGFRIHLQFSDGVEKTVDFGHFLERARHPTLKKYHDVTQFQNFRLLFGNLDWNDYEMCFPIADLYEGTI